MRQNTIKRAVLGLCVCVCAMYLCIGAGCQHVSHVMPTEDMDRASEALDTATEQHDLTTIMQHFEDIPESSVIDVATLQQMIEQDQEFMLLDIRGWRSYVLCYIAGSKNIPLGQQLEIRYSELPSNKTIVVIGQNNDRLAQAYQALREYDFQEQMIKVVDGGMDAWNAAGYPVLAQEHIRC